MGVDCCGALDVDVVVVGVVVVGAGADELLALPRNRSAHEGGFDLTDEERLSEDGFSVSIDAALATDVE